MDGISLQAGGAKVAAEGFQGLQVRNAGLHARGDDLGIEIRPGREDDDGQADTVLAQFQPLHGVGDSEIIRSGTLHHGREFHGSMPVRIGLDEHQEFRRRVQQGTEIPVIALAALQVQLQPGKVILSHHRIL